MKSMRRIGTLSIGLQEANWSIFNTRVESSIRYLGIVKGAARKTIPSGWTDEMQSLYRQFEEDDDEEI